MKMVKITTFFQRTLIFGWKLDYIFFVFLQPFLKIRWLANRAWSPVEAVIHRNRSTWGLGQILGAVSAPMDRQANAGENDVTSTGNYCCHPSWTQRLHEIFKKQLQPSPYPSLYLVLIAEVHSSTFHLPRQYDVGLRLGTILPFFQSMGTCLYKHFSHDPSLASWRWCCRTDVWWSITRFRPNGIWVSLAMCLIATSLIIAVYDGEVNHIPLMSPGKVSDSVDGSESSSTIMKICESTPYNSDVSPIIRSSSIPQNLHLGARIFVDMNACFRSIARNTDV